MTNTITLYTNMTQAQIGLDRIRRPITFILVYPEWEHDENQYEEDEIEEITINLATEKHTDNVIKTKLNPYHTSLCRYQGHYRTSKFFIEYPEALEDIEYVPVDKWYEYDYDPDLGITEDDLPF